MRRPSALLSLRRASGLLVVLAMVLGGCGDDPSDDTASDTGASDAAGEASTPSTPPADTGSTDGSDGSDGGTESTAPPDEDGSSTSAAGSTTPVDPADLPGEVIEIAPYEGASLAVVGVASDDTLNVRAGPGTDFDAAVELGPLAEGFTATGHNRVLDDDALWVEVQADGTTGWANGAYLAQLGGTRDITGEVEAQTEGASPRDIALDVAGRRGPSEGGPAPTVTVVDVQGTSEATVDLIGLGDDAQKGERLRVVVSDGALTVETTALCARGVSDGLCA